MFRTILLVTLAGTLIAVGRPASAHAIWQVNDKLSFDVGFRHAITNGSNVNEIRAGLTVGFARELGRATANESM